MRKDNAKARVQKEGFLFSFKEGQKYCPNDNTLGLPCRFPCRRHNMILAKVQEKTQFFLDLQFKMKRKYHIKINNYMYLLTVLVIGVFYIHSEIVSKYSFTIKLIL